MSNDAFQLLHDGVRRQIYEMKWTELRPMQVDAIRSILGGDGHVILSAGTASGKTEAAFLPILSSIADEKEGSVRAIYVGPLKALINDQFGRIEELCNHLDVRVYRWHGDVAASAKAKLINRPGGVLLITPESLESLFVNRSNALNKLFHGLRFVVIDELHSFLDNERGLQLRSLLYRVAARTEKPLRLIGLSATIGNPKAAKDYLDRDDSDRVKVIIGETDEPELRVRLHAYLAGLKGSKVETDVDDEDELPPDASRIAEDLVAHCGGHTNLVFANSRNDVELYGNICQRLAEREGRPDLFLVHHGSLSADLRRDTEETMKQSSRSNRPVTTFCSSTLEMGIDIGNVRMVGQIGAPYTVASLKQRVGRSGRRGKDTPRILRAYLECHEVDDKSDLFDRLHLGLIQTVAIIELLVQHWIEPAEPSSFDLSTLTQQIISLIAETGGTRAQDAYRTLCEHGAFWEVQPADFARLLRQLGAADALEQTPQGDLILGLIGEDIRKDKSFYATFMTADAFTVLHDGQRIGSVDQLPEIKQHMILAGRRWQVVAVDDRQHLIFVVPASGWKGAPFAGGGGVIHPLVVEKMRNVLQSTSTYAYIDKTAERLLNEARQTAAAIGFCTRRILPLDTSTTAFLPWVGGRTLDTLKAIFKSSGIDAAIEKRIALKINKPMATCLQLMNHLSHILPADSKILDELTGPPIEKYDWMLNDDLRRETRKRRWMDLPGATAAIVSSKLS